MIKTKIRKINPQKSNKMIYAVAGGLALVLLAFFILIIASGTGGNSRSMARILNYLKNTEGLVDIKTMELEKRVIIVYNSDSKNAANFEKVAHYAAVRLSRDWPVCEVLLARNRADRIVYSVHVRNSAIISEGPLPAGSDRP